MPRPKPNGLSPEETEQLRVTALLEVAAEVFLEAGFEAASTTEIARRAHASKQTFYARFPSKEKLFLAVINHRMERNSAAFSTFFNVQTPLREVLLGVGRHFNKVILSEEHITLVRIIYMEAQRFPEIGRAFLSCGPEQGVTQLATFLAQEAALGAIDTSDPQTAAEHFAALVVGDSLQRALLGVPPSVIKKRMEERLPQSVDFSLGIYEVR